MAIQPAISSGSALRSSGVWEPPGIAPGPIGEAVEPAGACPPSPEERSCLGFRQDSAGKPMPLVALGLEQFATSIKRLPIGVENGVLGARRSQRLGRGKPK